MGSGVSSIVAVDAGRVVLAASDGARGVELWQSNGTAAGTVIVDDIAPGTSSSNPTALVWSPTLFRVFFQADDGKAGVELRTISLPSLGP
jgi:ELWxxDGT repeat protein